MNHIFISYSRRKERFVTSVVERLREEGLSVWQDVSGKISGIPYSAKWFAAIEEALYTASGAVVFRSEEWEKSVPCAKEYELIKKLRIPAFEINLKKSTEICGNLRDEDDLTHDNEIYDIDSDGINADIIVEKIIKWASGEVCTGITNENRVWMFSSLSVQRLGRDKSAGIPRFKKRKEALAFLENLRLCEKYIDENGIKEDQELYQDIVKLINRSRYLTRVGLIIKPAVTAIFFLLAVGIIAVNFIYKSNREKMERNSEGLMDIESFHDDIYVDEVRAFLRMSVEKHDYGDYIYLLFENFSDVLDTEFPVDFYKSGSDKANVIQSLPIQNTLSGYEFEPSKDTGVFTVRCKKAENENYGKTTRLLLDSVPDAYAVDGEYLAIAAARQVYVYDLKRGYRPVELRYCYRDVESLRFDEMGRIFAITKAGDVYVWENPIREVIRENEEMPENAVDSGEYISTDGRFCATSSGDGTIKVTDVINNCVIYKQSAVSEPVKAIYIDERSWEIYAEGYSGAVYILDAGSVLSNYSYDVEEQFENYKHLGNGFINQMIAELEIAREW